MATYQETKHAQATSLSFASTVMAPLERTRMMKIPAMIGGVHPKLTGITAPPAYAVFLPLELCSDMIMTCH